MYALTVKCAFSLSHFISRSQGAHDNKLQKKLKIDFHLTKNVLVCTPKKKYRRKTLFGISHIFT